MEDKKKFTIISVIIFITILIIVYFYFNNSQYEEINYNQEIVVENETTVDNTVNTIIVHISGEVNNPGIIGLDEGGRIINAIEYAGGLTEYADITNVNLAYELQDGQKIYIPSIHDDDTEKNGIIKENSENIIFNDNNNSSKININKASESELQELNGIGESTARKIIQYRNENGNFKSIEDLKNISGIGDSKYEMIKEYICIK